MIKMNKYIRVLFASMFILSLVSCLKDKDYKDGIIGHDLAGVPKVIEIGNKFDILKSRTFGVDFKNEVTETTIFYVRLAAGEIATEDITVTLDTTGAAARLKAINANYVPLPLSFYTLNATALKVTIPKGQSEVAVMLKTNASQFSPSATYGLVYKIVAVDKPGYVISSNYGEYVVILGAKNAYDGVYTVVSGFVQRYTNPTTPTVGDALNGPLGGGVNPDMTLATLDASTVSVANLTWATGGGIGGIDNLRLRVDPVTNLVTMSALGNATLANWVGKVNKYDPATRTFTLNFDWNQTANRREFSIVIRWKRPR